MCKKNYEEYGHFMDNEQFLFSEWEFINTQSKDKLPIKCANCGETFYKEKHCIQTNIKNNQVNYFCSSKCKSKYQTKQGVQIIQCTQCGKEIKKRNSEILKSKNHFCSRSCFNTHKTRRNKFPRARGTSQIVKCAQCGKECRKQLGEIKASKSGNNFCSKSCAAKYNNTHKTFGCSRSKLELHLQNVLEEKYLNLNIEYNDRKALDGLELDIYIQSLNLAFELNGIFHYQPVFGKTEEEKNSRFQNILVKDFKKQQLCQEKGINMCVIDVSSQHYFTIKSSQKFVDAICFVIDKRIDQLQQQGIEINDIKIIKDSNVITPYTPKYKTEPCKYCGILKGEGDHSLCRWLPTLRKFGFDDNVIGTSQFQNEVDRIIELVRSEYWVNKLSLPQLAKKYGFDSHSNVYKFMKRFNIERDEMKKFQ